MRCNDAETKNRRIMQRKISKNYREKKVSEKAHIDNPHSFFLGEAHITPVY